jgi:aspartyl-tRNA(Asn)/glutamyl-tRNA(Gln) amidotransferase subunit C
MPEQAWRFDVSAIAALATIDLTPDELSVYAKQLSDVLQAVATLAELDTTGIPPTAAIVTRHPLDRPDELRPCLDREAAVAAAPDPSPDAAYFRVPRVIA